MGPILIGLRWTVICLSFLVSTVQMVAAQSALEPAITLTTEERAWLAAHPDITLGYTDAFEPEVIVNPDGTYRGIQVDILNELNRRLGTRIRLQVDPVQEVIAKAQKKKIDGILALHPDYADKLGLLKTRSYLDGYPAVFAKKDVAFRRPSDLASKRIAVIDKIFFSEEIVQQHGPGATVLKVKDAKEGLQRIENGQADFFLGATLNGYLITKYQLLNLANQFVFFDRPINTIIGTRSDWPELSAILDKGLASFSKEEIERISAKWVQLRQPENIIQLTAEEQAWLAQKHIVQVRVVNIPPYVILKEDGELEGISIDYLNFMAERTGVEFEYGFSGKTFPEALDGLINRRGPDLISSMMRTPEREKSILFSKDYFKSPYVIFTHQNDKTFISDMNDLSGKKIALPGGTVIHEKIKKDYPNLKTVLFDNDSKAIEAVATEKADAYIGNLTLASFHILEKGLSGLKIAGPSPFGDHVFSMGIRNDWPALVSILDKTLATMSQAEHAKIRNKYIAIRYEHAERTAFIKWFTIISGAAFLVSLLFFFWNRQLSGMVKKRTAEIHEKSDYLKSLTASMPDAIFSVTMPGRKIEWANDTFKVLGYEAAECIGKTTGFLYPSRTDYLTVGEAMTHAVDEGKEVLHIEQNMRKKNGEVFPADITISIFKVDGEVVSVTGIVRDISERRHREERLQEYQDRLKALASQLTVAEEKERRRIAADLHDHVGQALALARMQVATTKKRITDASMSADLEQVSETLYDALQDTRQLMFDLSPPSLNELGLSAAIVDWLEVQIGKRYNLETAFLDELDDPLQDTIEESVRVILFRNVRELLFNVVKHAQAAKVGVHLKCSNGQLKIVVEDDGMGFDSGSDNQKESRNGSFGLFSIQERMADLGGSLEIVSEPGKGCKATLNLPIGEKR